jgi:hypothetical protein
VLCFNVGLRAERKNMTGALGKRRRENGWGKKKVYSTSLNEYAQGWRLRGGGGRQDGRDEASER